MAFSHSVKKLLYGIHREYYNLSLIYDNKGRYVCGAVNVPFGVEIYNESRNFLRSSHGEKLAIKKFFKKGYNPSLKYSLYSIRIRNNRLVLGGKPCSMCTKLLEKITPKFIQKVYYL
jgi:hypothetical protein